MPRPKETAETPQFNPEALAAFENAKVLDSIKNSAWFKHYYLDEVNFGVKLPQRDDRGAFKKRLLTEFIDVFRSGVAKGEKYTLYTEVVGYLRKMLVDEQGNLFSINALPFFDPTAFAKTGAIDIPLDGKEIPRYRVDRTMFARIEPMLLCIVAPESIRKEVVKLFCSWNEKDYSREAEIVLWAEVIRAGALWYLKEAGL